MTLPPGTTTHRREGDDLPSLACAVVTVSDSRTEATDESGALIRRLVEHAGHRVCSYALLPNEDARLRAHLEQLLAEADTDVLLLTGGTGLGRRDRTVDVVRPMLDRELPGFGEIFRMISYQEQIGAAAILSRALAGSVRGKFVVSMPGSKAAVELALTRIVLPELRHAIRELRR